MAPAPTRTPTPTLGTSGVDKLSPAQLCGPHAYSQPTSHCHP